MDAAELLTEDVKKTSKEIVTSGGVALVDPSDAARLLKANGVLESAKQHMHFHTVVLKKNGKKVIVYGARKK